MQLIILSEDYLQLSSFLPCERKEQALFYGAVSW
jgi:hypothetical protein